MGIPSYFSYIVKHYGDIYNHIKDIKQINNLYMDCNSIIYDCLRNTKYKSTLEFNDKDFESKLLLDICKKIEYYIERIHPTDIVYIAFDGIAPVAKLEQQRTRRYKSQLLKQIETSTIKDFLNSETNDKLQSQIKKEYEDYKTSQESQIWNSVAITPGTHFMSKLDTFIEDYFGKKNKEFKTNIKHNTKTTDNTDTQLQYIISGSNKHGEGEHKLFQFIRTHEKHHTNTTTCIYGLDADLIMLSLNHTHMCRSIYLFREIPDYDNDLKSYYKNEEFCILNIKKLSNQIMESMTAEIKSINLYNDRLKIRQNKTHDYIFISFLLGNDFLPHHPSLNIRTHGIDTLLNSYHNIIPANKSICKNTDDGVYIDWKLFRKLLSELANNESSNMKYEYGIIKKHENRNKTIENLQDILFKINTIPTKSRDIEYYIDPYTKGWQERYYNSLFGIQYNSSHIREITLNYLEGLEWTLKYYTTGCVNYRWKYKYNYPPLFEDIVKFMPLFDCELITSDMRTIDSYTQLSYVLPRESLILLPDKIRTMLLDTYKYNYQSHEMSWAFCKYLWESHIEFSYMDIERLEHNIQMVL
jgi:5'-3' exonuclease